MGALAVLIGIAYANSFAGVFLFDDAVSITRNESLRAPWTSSVLFPPATSTLAGRPVANLTFALNYAWGGVNPWGYHAVNLLIHALTTFALFGVVRRTLLWPVLAKFASEATALALAIAALWSVHPLLTGTVTYLSQRTEGLMALCYLTTLYAFIRGTESRSRVWFAVSLVACATGMAAKEVMVTAPVMVFLYDRTFVAGTFRAAWRERRGFYLGLSATWALLALLMATGLDQRGVGFGTGVGAFSYARTEIIAVLTYARLSLFPHPLVFDYGAVFVEHLSEIALPAVILSGLLAGTIYLLIRRPALGFVAAWFFVVLAPTSSFVPVALQPIAENRAYLPSLTFVVLAVLGLHGLIRRWHYVACAALVVLALTLTIRRNAAYHDELALMQETVALRPENPRAHNNYGFALLERGRNAEALAAFETAVRLKPDYADAVGNRANALLRLGRPAEALAGYQQALAGKADWPEAENNAGNALVDLGRPAEALPYFDRALHLKPQWAEAHVNKGNALLRLGRASEAVALYERALALDPTSADACANLGLALLQLNRPAEARSRLEQATRLDPKSASARNNLGYALLAGGAPADALPFFQEALRLKPDYVEALLNLGRTFTQLNRFAEALDVEERALQLSPANAPLRVAYAETLLQTGKAEAALPQFAEALRLRPDHAQTHYLFGGAFFKLQRWAEAEAQFTEALRLDPSLAEARFFRGFARAQRREWSAAATDFEQAITARPDWPEARNAYGTALFKLNRPAEAAAQFETALRLKPDFTEAQQNLSRLRN